MTGPEGVWYGGDSMAAPAYRAARGSTGLIIVLVLLMEAGMLGMVPLAGPKHWETWRAWLFAVPPVAALVIGLTVAFSRHRRRLAGVRQELERLGFQAQMKPKPEDPSSVELWGIVQPLASGLWLQGGPQNFQWIAWAQQQAGQGGPEGPGLKVWLFEFEYVTGTGKGTQVHHRTVALWPVGYPGLPGTELGREAGFWMSRLGWLERRAYRKNALPPQTLGGLGGAWTLFGDVSTGERFVTGRIRALLEHAPRGECWSLGGGWVACVFRNRLDGRNLGLFYERARALLKEPH